VQLAEGEALGHLSQLVKNGSSIFQREVFANPADQSPRRTCHGTI